MASGLNYYQRVGTLDSVQREKMGKKLVDPHNGRVFRYVKIVEGTIQPKPGSPVARVGAGFGSSWNVIADFSSLKTEDFIGIVMTPSMATGSGTAASNGHYLWVMQEGTLGQDSQSHVYSTTIYAYVCTGIVKDDNLLWTGDNSVGGGSKVAGASLQAQFSNQYGSGGNTGAASEGAATTSVLGRTGLIGNLIGQAYSTDTSSKLVAGFIKADRVS